MFEFALPMLLLALPIPLIMRFLPATSLADEAAIRAPFAQRWRSLASTHSLSLKGNLLQLILLSGIWILLVVASVQ